MGITTAIQWTDHTFNPWWGCTKVSPGCANCYADTFANRLGMDIWGPGKERRFFGDKHWQEPLKWNEAAKRAGERRRVFCASMADVFEDRPDLDLWREKLWRLIQQCPWLDWQLVTKRPENFATMLPWAKAPQDAFDRGLVPWKNVWLLTSVENQEAAEKRIPILKKTAAAVRGLSMEPLLGPVDVLKHIGTVRERKIPGQGIYIPPAINWIILGGESGSGSRACHVEWVRSLVQQCQAAQVAVFVKQLGQHITWDRAEGRTLPLNHKKGGDMAEWPPDLRVREFPC